MAVQRKRRRGTASNNASFTGAEGEIVYLTDSKRIAGHDGVTVGGKLFLNSEDVQNNVGVYATVGGTANAITLTNSVPVKAYTAGLEVMFKPTSNNTGAVTLAVDGLGGGAKALEKVVSGVLTALAADDLRSGSVYSAIYDGTKFQLQGGQGSGVTQGTVTALSGSSVVLTVDFTTYSVYQLQIVDMSINAPSTGNIDVSSDGGSTYATAATRNTKDFGSTTFSTSTTKEFPTTFGSGGAQSVLNCIIAQASTSGVTMLSTQGTSGSGSLVGGAVFSTSAAVNRIRVKGDGAFATGSVILTPIAKR